MATNKGTSLLDQNETLKKKWGGDTLNYDIQGAIKGYQSNLAKYNDAATTQEEKDRINAMYGGDISKWNKDTAYQEYMNDLDYIKSVDALNQGYKSISDQAKQMESRAMQYADTRRQLMQKYLPETLLAQGVANTGYTADALLKAENNYNQYVMGAMSDRAAAEQDAMQSYQNALRDYKTQKAENEYKIFLDQQAKNEQGKAAMSGFIGDIDAGADINSVIKQAQIAGLSAEDIADLRKYDNESTKRAQNELFETFKNSAGSWTKEQLEENKAYLTDSQYNTLLNLYYRPANTYTQGDVKATNIRGSTGEGRDLAWPADSGDTFRVSVDGTDYNLKTGESVATDSEVYKFAHNPTNDIGDGQVFMYNGKLYVRNGNVVQTIQEKKGYNDVISYMTNK